MPNDFPIIPIIPNIPAPIASVAPVAHCIYPDDISVKLRNDIGVYADEIHEVRDVQGQRFVILNPDVVKLVVIDGRVWTTDTDANNPGVIHFDIPRDGNGVVIPLPAAGADIIIPAGTLLHMEYGYYWEDDVDEFDNLPIGTLLHMGGLC
jgi:hypothetical protein